MKMNRRDFAKMLGAAGIYAAMGAVNAEMPTSDECLQELTDEMCKLKQKKLGRIIGENLLELLRTATIDHLYEEDESHFFTAVSTKVKRYFLNLTAAKPSLMM